MFLPSFSAEKSVYFFSSEATPRTKQGLSLVPAPGALLRLFPPWSSSLSRFTSTDTCYTPAQLHRSAAVVLAQTKRSLPATHRCCCPAPTRPPLLVSHRVRAARIAQ